MQKTNIKKSVSLTLICLIVISNILTGCANKISPTSTAEDSIVNNSTDSEKNSESSEYMDNSTNSNSISELNSNNSSYNSSKSIPVSKSSSQSNSQSSKPLNTDKLINGEIVFETNEDSIIDVLINTAYSDSMREKLKTIIWSLDDSFNIPFATIVKSNDKTMLGSLYLKKGTHKFKVMANEGVLPVEITSASYSFVPSKVYFYPRLELSEKWMKTLYNPLFNGYVEAEGWEDMWTHCQYLPEKFLYTKLSGKAEFTANAKNSADKFIIGKMIQPTGAVHTIYRAKKNIYEQSIEPDMKQNVWDLWRGNAAAIEEMLNCYKQFGDFLYLDKAKLCADYVLSSWPVIDTDGAGNLYANLTDGATLQTQSIGRLVMVLCQLYSVTNDIKYKNAAIAQGKGILRSQGENGLFFSNITVGWQHGNAFANAMLALGWLYKTTQDPIYKTAISKAFEAYDLAWTDDYGSLKLSGTNRITGMSTYLAGRMAQGLFTCAMFTGEISQFRIAEKTLYYAFGRNISSRDMQNKTNGSYYYQLDYSGASNIETSCEVNLGTQQIYYLQTYWH